MPVTIRSGSVQNYTLKFDQRGHTCQVCIRALSEVIRAIGPPASSLRPGLNLAGFTQRSIYSQARARQQVVTARRGLWQHPGASDFKARVTYHEVFCSYTVAAPAAIGLQSRKLRAGCEQASSSQPPA